MKENTFSKNIIYIILFTFCFTNVFMFLEISALSDPIIDQRARKFYDPFIIDGFGDVSLLSLVIVDDSLEIEVFFAKPLPASGEYRVLGSIWINSDNNKTTGYQRANVGVDVRVDFTYVGSGGSIGEFFIWDSTLESFIMTEEELLITSSSNQDSISIIVPLEILQIDKYSTIEVGSIFTTRVSDFISQVIKYDFTEPNNITIDGLSNDWILDWKLVTEIPESYPSFSDFISYYITNNQTHLLQRFDVKENMPTEPSEDLIEKGWLRIYYDTDDDINTGKSMAGIGADKLYLLNTQKSNTLVGNPTYGYLHTWNETTGDWNWLTKSVLNGAFINSTYEFAIPLSSGYLDSSSNSIGIFLQQYDAEIMDNFPNNIWAWGGNFSIYEPPIVEIYELDISERRVNVGSNQTILFYTRWDSKTQIDTGYIFINGIERNINNEGQANLTVISEEVGKSQYSVTGVSILGIDKFNQTIDSPAIIWDKVIIDIPKNYRINQGKELSNKFAYYAYNGEDFAGKINTNINISEKNIGKYEFIVTEICDDKYNLTKFDSFNYSVIIDKVILDLKIDDNRVDIGTWPNLVVTGYYDYDDSPFEGEVNVVIPKSTNHIGEYTYYISNISDIYELSTYESNEVKCIWDRIQIVDETSNTTMANIGESVRIWVSAIYDYDDQVFSADEGIIYLNYEPMEWSDEDDAWFLDVTSSVEVEKSFFVSSVNDRKYNLTQINHQIEPVNISWIKKGTYNNLYFYIIASFIAIILSLVYVYRYKN